MKQLQSLVLVSALFVVGCQSLPDPGRSAVGEGALPRAWTVDDTLDLARIGAVAISPDGAWVLYTESRLDWAANGRERSVFLVASSGGPPELREDLEDARGLGFTPDSSRITFVADADDSDQVFTVGLGGGTAERITDHPGGVEDFAWSPDGSCVFFTAEEPRDPVAQAAWDAGGDAIFVGEHGNGLEAQRWSNLWVHDLASGAEERLTNERATIGDFDVAPDGQRVIFNASSDNRTNYFWRSELFVVNRTNGMVVQLTENDAPEDSPKWSPDGRTVAYHSPDPEWFDLRHGYLWLMDPVTGDARRLEGQHQGELGAFEWAPDSQHILFGESRGVFSNLYELDTKADSVRALTDLEGSLRARAFADDGSTFVYSFGDHTSPADLFVGQLSGAEPVRITTANPWVGTEVTVAASEVVNWTSSDGRAVEGVLTLPPDWDGATALPLIMDIHGGPPGYWGAQFEREHQLYASHGYAVFAPNPRGSSSYGDEHLRALMGDVGGGEYEDLMSGVDHLIARGVADPERLALRGWSWGGILGAWTITRTNRFKAASLGAMVGDWTAEIGGGLMFDLQLHYIQGIPWVDRDEWDSRSALSFVTNVETPTLLLHGERDDVSTVNQSQMFYTALRARDVPVRFIKFPRQGHGIREPHLERIALVEELRWFEQHVRGERWTPTARGAEPVAVEEPTKPERTWLTGKRGLSGIELELVELMESAQIPGLSAAVVKDGVLVWSSGLGWADPAQGIPVDRGTLFQLASISKTVTATVVMQLVEQGQLDLDADLDELLPFSVRHPEHPDVALTLRMLLTHTAGLRDNWNVLTSTWVKGGDFPLSLHDSIAAYFTPAGEFYSADKSFQDWAPGTRGSYANVGFALLAFAAETASGRPFEELVREDVLGPLGIEGGFRLAEVDQERVAVPQRWSREGGFEGLGHHGYLDFASGTLRVSATGLARFLAAIQLGGELDGARVLAEATVADMLRVQLPDIEAEQGLAWYQDRIDGEIFWGHDGGDPGVATQMYFRPSDGVGFVLLLNGSPRGRGAERKLVEALLRIGAAATTP